MVDEGLKKRLIGASVLVSLVVIFVPMLLEKEALVESRIYSTNIPQHPGHNYSSSLIPKKGDELGKMPAVERPEVVPMKSVIQPSKGSIAVVERKVKPSTKPSDTKPVPVTPRVGLSAWVVQVGSFSKQANADKLIADLRGKKFPAFLEQAEVNGKIHYRVKVGPEVNRALAEKMLSSLNKELKPMKLKGTLKAYP